MDEQRGAPTTRGLKRKQLMKSRSYRVVDVDEQRELPTTRGLKLGSHELDRSPSVGLTSNERPRRRGDWKPREDDRQRVLKVVQAATRAPDDEGTETGQPARHCRGACRRATRAPTTRGTGTSPCGRKGDVRPGAAASNESPDDEGTETCGPREQPQTLQEASNESPDDEGD